MNPMMPILGSAACLSLVLFVFTPAAGSAQAQDSQDQRPTLWIIGDSTVRNSSKDQRGWGDEIAPFFDTTRINVVNRARGGRSSRTYQTEGLWDEVLADMKSGDFVMVQFGHNDGGPLDDKHRARGSIRGIGDESKDIFDPIMNKPEVVRTFGWYMNKYISDARAKEATPIVVSYVPRAPKPGSEPSPPGEPTSYALWAAQVAEREGACFIDLHKQVLQSYALMDGDAVRQRYFAEDGTHTNEEGARHNAKAVVEGLKAMKQCPLANFLLENKG